jgi:ornithine cyclodeaminase
MLQISAEQILDCFNYQEFIPILKEAFCGDYEVPNRHHYDYDSGVGPNNSVLLIMPAWSNKEYVGVKVVTVSPYNGQFNLPGIQGFYTLIEAKNGLVKAQIDAKVLTVKRTAATSALASSFLSRKDSKTLLMVGTGALSTELIQAHCAVRPIEKVLIWGRNFEKSQRMAAEFKLENIEFTAIASIEAGMTEADIISVATLSQEPLVFGKWLKPGQHLDLVGAYRPDIREADDECINVSSVFIDHEGAIKETGDVVIPLSNGTLDKKDIKADLFELCGGKKKGRANNEEITWFKSVGHALEDLSGALYIIEKLNK